MAEPDCIMLLLATVSYNVSGPSVMATQLHLISMQFPVAWFLIAWGHFTHFQEIYHHTHWKSELK